MTFIPYIYVSATEFLKKKKITGVSAPCTLTEWFCTC